MSNVLVVGYGSIGSRHARLLAELGCRTTVVSRRKVNFPLVYQELVDALSKELPQYIVIANETSRHYDTLQELARLGYEGTVLVEKPAFAGSVPVADLPFRKIFVAYNLRFHPVIRRIREMLAGERIISVQAYAGQYLPEWRPGTDYRTSYSASSGMGGGVLRDLSHEIDYLLWMLGSWEGVAALGGHFSDLEIASEDMFSLMMVMEKCPAVTLQLNYLDRKARRFLLINTASHTIKADLIGGSIALDRDTELFTIERDGTYRAMHEAILSGEADELCTLEAGLQALRLIEAAEQSVLRKEWVRQ